MGFLDIIMTLLQSCIKIIDLDLKDQDHLIDLDLLVSLIMDAFAML